MLKIVDKVLDIILLVGSLCLIICSAFSTGQQQDNYFIEGMLLYITVQVCKKNDK